MWRMIRTGSIDISRNTHLGTCTMHVVRCVPRVYSARHRTLPFCPVANYVFFFKYTHLRINSPSSPELVCSLHLSSEPRTSPAQAWAAHVVVSLPRSSCGAIEHPQFAWVPAMKISARLPFSANHPVCAAFHKPGTVPVTFGRREAGQIRSGPPDADRRR